MRSSWGDRCEQDALPEAADGRVGWLDGVRGLAVISVMVFHFDFLARQDRALPMDVVLDKVTGLGWAGVDLFFVLSGFLITGILVDTRGAPNALRNFYARRVLRIFPLYYAFLVALFIVLPALHHVRSPQYVWLRASQGWFWLYLTNVWVLLRNGVAASLFGTAHLWSLAVEEQFYLLWPAVVLACGRRGTLAACAAALGLSPLLRLLMFREGVSPYVMYTFTFSHLDGLAFGAALALVIRSPRARSFATRAALPAAIISGAWLIALIAVLRDASNLNAGMELAGLTPITIFWTGVVAHALTCAGRLRLLCSAAPLRIAGRFSYGMYLFHWPLASLLAATFGARTALPAFPASPLLSESLFFVAAGGGTFALSWLSWHVYEKQFLKLKSRFVYGLPRAPIELAPDHALETHAA